MRITLATHGFAFPGGSETYVLTVAEQFERLGHEVTILAGETGPFSDFAGERGLSIRSDLEAFQDRCDAVIVQDAILSYRLAEQLPHTPQLFRAASDVHDLQLPPGLPGLVRDVVVCSDRVGRRIAALATRPAVHRLRQPVDTERFMPAGPPASRPRRAVLLGNHLRGPRLAMIRSALAEIGVSAEHVGLHGESNLSPEQAIWGADIVVAKGRAALEGMACGRPVFVYDQFGGDGWVTPERYPAMEADNFAGLSGPPIAGAQGLVEELSRYDAAMGLVNRELTVRYHGARAHTQQLCALLERAQAPQPLQDASLRELSRLVHLQWRTELRAIGFEDASRRCAEYAHQLSAELEALRGHASAVEGERDRLIDDLERVQAILGTRRVRVGLRLGRAADRVRPLRSR